MGNKIKTVIASVLKPVDDTRMYEKIGLSLQQTNRYEVNIIGFNSKNLPPSSEIVFHPLFSFSNMSWRRLFAPLSILIHLLKIAPTLIIATTFEVLVAAMAYKIICFNKDIKLVYDVRENYALNLLTNKKNTFLIRLLALGIQCIEKISQSYISLNILAEKGYTKEISFFSKPSIVIPNAYKPCLELEFGAPDLPEKFRHKAPKLVFNGTISEIYGIRQTLNFANTLSKHYPDLLLIIIGHVTDTNLLNHLLIETEAKENIYARINNTPLPHQEILKMVSIADYGIVAHQPVESIRNCFPTRIFEYMALQKPFFLQDHCI